jgi:hypothetical protein
MNIRRIGSLVGKGPGETRGQIQTFDICFVENGNAEKLEPTEALANGGNLTHCAAIARRSHAPLRS